MRGIASFREGTTDRRVRRSGMERLRPNGFDVLRPATEGVEEPRAQLSVDQAVVGRTRLRLRVMAR
jgi:hypothetical protein